MSWRPALAALLLALTGAALAGPSVRVEGTSLALQLGDGRWLRGPAVAGHEVQIDALVLRVDGVQPGSGRAPWLYDLAAQVDGVWQPVCAPDAYGRRLALVLAGSVDTRGRFVPDPARLSVTCTGGAVGKCVLAGYEPRGRSLPRFQACIRMFRADYCGDGRSWTRDGTVIDLFDRDGIQTSSQPALPLEAAWGPDGAVCVHHTRVPDRLSLRALRQACPKALQVEPCDCDEPTARRLPRALLFNRSAPGL